MRDARSRVAIGTLVALPVGMGTTTFYRRLLQGVASTLLALATTALAARANELSARASAAPGIRIVGPDDVLRDFCEWRGNVLWLVLPGGLEYELVTSVRDPVITNPGDGKFHPYDPAEVRRAFDEVRFPLQRVSADVYVLPYPRRNGLESAAGPGLVLLSPGTRPLPVEHQHAESVHELGHVVQHACLPDANVSGWNRYRAIRGIENTAVFSSHAAHADRPHEIFAEDFRALFGGELANYSGTIENAELPSPASVVGLERFLIDLADATPLALGVGAWPNPARGDVTFARVGASVALDVYDLAGRRLATLSPRASTGGVEWRWDGHGPDGRPVVGVVFARPRDGDGPGLRLIRLP